MFGIIGGPDSSSEARSSGEGEREVENVSCVGVILDSGARAICYIELDFGSGDIETYYVSDFSFAKKCWALSAGYYQKQKVGWDDVYERGDIILLVRCRSRQE